MRQRGQEVQYYVTNDRMVRERRRLDPDDLEQITNLLKLGPVAFISLTEMVETASQEASATGNPAPSPPPEGFITITSMKQFRGMSRAAGKTHDKFARMVKKKMTPEQAAIVRAIRITRGFSWRAVARFCWEMQHWSWRSWRPPSNQLMGMAICQRAAEMVGEDFMKPPWN